jgi:hypothetical protein
MSLNSTYYKNTTRTISGLINPVFDTDVVLLCDTSAGAVELTLLPIPTDNFSTQYRLYVVDKSNNASANNITIKAPTGFSVNNSITAVINVNSGTAIVNISSNKTYNAQFNYQVGGGGNPVAIKNEGTQITPSVSSIDFVGAPVTASAVGNDVTVTIEQAPIKVQNEGTQITPSVSQFNFVGNLVNATAVGNDVTVEINSFPAISVTYIQIKTILEANSLIANQTYLITNTDYIQTSAVNLPSATFVTTVPMYIEALSTSELDTKGVGVFLNPDFNNVGDYSGVVGFVAQKGIWDISLSVVIGDVVIWNNAHWFNNTGTNLDAPSDANPEWSFLVQSQTNGYVKQLCSVDYQFSTNNILTRRDEFNNYVENNIDYFPTSKVEAFLYFQWGNGIKTNGNLVASQSALDCWNNSNLVLANKIEQYTTITFQKNGNKGLFIANNFKSSTINLLQNEGSFLNNEFFNIQENLELNIAGIGSSISSNFFQNLQNAQISATDNTAFNRNRINGNVADGNLSLQMTTTIFSDNIIEKFNLIGIKSTGGNIQDNVFIDKCFVEIKGNKQNISKNYVRNAVFSITNLNEGAISSNEIVNNAQVQLKDIGIYGRFQGNYCNDLATVNINLLEGNFNENKISNNCNIEIENIQGNATPSTGVFSFNEFYNSVIATFGVIEIGGKFWYNSILNGSTIVLPSGAFSVKGDVKYNRFDNNSDWKILGIDTNGVFQNNTVNNFSKIVINEFLQGAFGYNELDNGSQIAIENVLKVGIDNGSFFSNKIYQSSVEINYVSEKGQFNSNIITNNCDIKGKNVDGNFRFNVFNNSTIEFSVVTVDGNLNDNQFQYSTLSIFEDLESPFAFNQFTNSNFSYKKTVSALSNGVYGNVLVGSSVGFGVVVKGFVNNNLTQSVFLLQDPLLLTRFDIIDWFESNDWNNVQFRITNGNQNGSIRETVMNGAFFQRPTFSYQINGGVCQDGIATTQYILDLLDPTIYDTISKTLTIPTNMEQFFGVYVLENGSGQVIEKIANLSLSFPTKFITDASSVGFSIDFVVLNNQVGTAISGICSTSTAPYPQTFPIRFQTISDFIVIDNQGNGGINLINQYNAYP